MKAKRFLALLLMVVMLVGLLQTSVFAYFDLDSSLNVSAEGKTYSLFTDDLNDECYGMTFLYVVERDGRYYTMRNPRYSEYTEVDSVSAIDITEYYNADTDTFSGIEDSANIGVMQLQRDDYHQQDGLYLDGNMAIKLSDPWESKGEDWFEKGIRYCPAENYGGGGPGWQVKGDGSGYIFSYSAGWDTVVYGVLDLKSTGTSEYIFALRDKSAEYNELIQNANIDDAAVDVTAYLYAAPCGHEQGADYAAYDAPTCMEKGCKEYWYCRLCETYFSNREMTEAYEEFPAIPALEHDWDSEKCNNCDRPVPVYSKVTNKTDFFALADDTMYVLVAEYEGKYYTPDIGELYLYVFDRDGDGYADIYNVDDNSNGTPDILEIDYNENGVYDYLENCETEEERKAYFKMLCDQYLTNLIYGQAVSLPVKEITLNADGTISHDAVKDALEFEMINLHTREDIDQYIKEGMTEEILRYSYECVMQFVIPNTFIGSPCFIPQDRGYGQRIQNPEADTHYWSVLFYNDRESYPVYDWETDEYSNTLEFLDICKEGSLALCKSWSYFSPDSGATMGCLRLRDYNGELSFVVGNNDALEGSEYVNDGAGGYYDTNDKQACVYLYASDSYQDSHICDFGDWVSIDDSTHKKICSVCKGTRTAAHHFDAGVVTKEATHLETGVKTFTCTDRCGYYYTEDMPKTTEHQWTEWLNNNNNGTHTRYCRCGATETNDCTYDAGIVTKEATHYEEGEKTYTCTICGGTKIEAIPIPIVENKVIPDEQGNRYKVTKSDAKAGEVTFAKPKSSAKGTVKVPDKVTIDNITYKVNAIEANAFKNNKNITKVSIGKNVTVIGKNAFSGCAKLKTVKLGAAVTTIGDKAFYKCTSLTGITIPAKVTRIGTSAFEGCKKLKTITVKTTKLKSVGKKALKGIYAKAKIKVPKSKLTKYKSLFKNKGQSKNVKVTK